MWTDKQPKLNQFLLFNASICWSGKLECWTVNISQEKEQLEEQKVRVLCVAT